eukprot:Hpha_TRINITY_DN16156_c3_g1::TRINITY_DN16156_c3_g1_i1::g.3481::m.3481/K18211/SNAP25; synaptosomal-associated protein 25
MSDTDSVSSETAQARALQAKKKELQKDTLASLHRTLGTTGKIQQTAADTTETLKKQEEQIDRIARDTAETKDDLRRSEKLVKQIGSFFHGVFGRAPKSKSTAADAKGGAVDAAGAAGSPAGRSGGKQRHADPLPATQESQMSEEDAALEAILHATRQIKQQSQGIGTTLQRQNEKLDTVSQEVQGNTEQTKKLNKKMRALC